MNSRHVWEKRWTKKFYLLDRISNFYRIFILGWLIGIYERNLFKEKVMFVECDSGTGRTH